VAPLSTGYPPNSQFLSILADLTYQKVHSITLNPSHYDEIMVKLSENIGFWILFAGFIRKRKTARWKYDVWPFVKCIFDGFFASEAGGKKQSVSDAFRYMLTCNPNIGGEPVKADRPLLKENPQIKYGSALKRGSVYIH
jgi:hypothetical protein